MSTEKPNKNKTAYKKGDVIMFLRDIKKDRSLTCSKKEVLIPKNAPVTVKKISNHHIWVIYKGETYWLRCILERMAPATHAATVLFGENNVDSSDIKK